MPQTTHNYDGIVEPLHEAMHNYDGIVEKHNYDGIVELPKASVKFNEDADFSQVPAAPVSDFKPIEFTPSNFLDDASTLQRVGEGFRQLGSTDRPVRPTSPDLIGKSITLTLPDRGRKPSKQEIVDAYFNALGARAVNERYRAETGNDLEVPDVSDEDLEMGHDEKARVYQVKVAPTQAALTVLNAYGQGGMAASQKALRDLYAADDEAAQKEAQKLDAARGVVRKLGYDPDNLEGNPLARGISRAGLGATRLVNNLSATVRNPADAANDAEFINEATASIPKSKSAVGRVVEDVTQAGASMPLYMAAGPYGAGAVAYTQNLDRGQEAAVGEGVKMGVAGGVAHGTGQAIEDLSPVARQFVSRHMAGMTNVGIDKLSGSDRSAVESYLAGAILPVGKKAEETGPTHDYVHETLGNLKRVPDQSGIGKGWVRVMTDDGEVGVVRAPNPAGQGGVRNTDGTLPRPTRKVGEKVLDAVNIPRAVQTSYDLSAVGRQGLMLSVLHPGKATQAFGRSIPALFSEGAADKVLHDIDSSPYAPLARDSGLYLSSFHHKGQTITGGEEGFQSQTAQNLIPGVRASERAYVVFLDKLRMDSFSAYAETHPNASPETLKDIAATLNDFSGRASLGKFGEKHATALSQMFYSPRFQLSRVSTLTRPFRGTKEARSYAAKELVKFVSAGVATLGLARLAGLDVNVDVLSSDFGKIKVGNTRVDIFGAGFQPIARYTAQLMAGQATSQDGETRSRSRLSTALNFLRTRAAPQVTVPLDTVLGKDVEGKPATLSNLPKRALMPLAWRDIENAVADDLKQGGSGVRGAAVGSLGLFGAGVNTITPKTTDERLNEYVQRMKTSPENQGLSDGQLRHNARVSLEENRLLNSVDESKREEARKVLNTHFYNARVRGSQDYRAVPAIERVFNERLKSAESLLKRRGLK